MSRPVLERVWGGAIEGSERSERGGEDSGGDAPRNMSRRLPKGRWTAGLKVNGDPTLTSVTC